MSKTIIADTYNINEIVNYFRENKIVCLPTDTVYAMSSNATSIDTIKKIYRIKQRSLEKPLPIFVSNINMAQQYVNFSLRQLKFIKKFWPGALTVVTRVLNNTCIPSLLVSKNKVALRIPNSILIQNICKKLNKPIVGTSANLSSESSINNFTTMKRKFNSSVDVIVKDINAIVNINTMSSTIIELIDDDNYKILREGPIKAEELYNYL